MFVRLAVFANYGRYDLGSPVAPHATGHGRHPRLPRDLLLVLELDGRGPGELCDRLLRDCDSHHFALWRREAPYRLNVGASIVFGSRHERRSEAGKIITICLTTMGGLGSKLYRVVTFLEALKLLTMLTFAPQCCLPIPPF